MLDRLAALPFWQAFAALFVIVMARSNATYWIGRGAMAGWRRGREHGPSRAAVSPGAVPESRSPHAVQESNQSRRAEGLIQRLGPVAVTLSYLTVGIQTAIHLAAGVLRMPLRSYLPAAIVGSMAWAALYATIGIAVVQAWLAARAGSWWALAGIAGLLLVGLATWLASRQRAQRHTPCSG